MVLKSAHILFETLKTAIRAFGGNEKSLGRGY